MVQPTTAISTRTSQLGGSVSNTDLTKTITTPCSNVEQFSGDLSKWNPFEDPTPFSQMSEDYIFGAEFDKIRREGSETSRFFWFNLEFHVLEYKLVIIKTLPLNFDLCQLFLETLFANSLFINVNTSRSSTLHDALSYIYIRREKYRFNFDATHTFVQFISLTLNLCMS